MSQDKSDLGSNLGIVSRSKETWRNNPQNHTTFLTFSRSALVWGYGPGGFKLQLFKIYLGPKSQSAFNTHIRV